jgi:hypothetical protein
MRFFFRPKLPAGARAHWLGGRVLEWPEAGSQDVEALLQHPPGGFDTVLVRARQSHRGAGKHPGERVEVAAERGHRSTVTATSKAPPSFSAAVVLLAQACAVTADGVRPVPPPGRAASRRARRDGGRAPTFRRGWPRYTPAPPPGQAR